MFIDPYVDLNIYIECTLHMSLKTHTSLMLFRILCQVRTLTLTLNGCMIFFIPIHLLYSQSFFARNNFRAQIEVFVILTQYKSTVLSS